MCICVLSQAFVLYGMYRCTYVCVWICKSIYVYYVYACVYTCIMHVGSSWDEEVWSCLKGAFQRGLIAQWTHVPAFLLWPAVFCIWWTNELQSPLEISTVECLHVYGLSPQAQFAETKMFSVTPTSSSKMHLSFMSCQALCALLRTLEWIREAVLTN